ncbi:hypothetical protein C6B37_01205 [Candidatus Phytoplasma phoenicium]|uniref:Uncharacterized protein n=1 Tax=Candidatus Phytoplasma phoenicium TaxID=198422 RepID=A0A2S8NUW2_9MOLU|nr:hypothetical protein C6B37_01205 [Candidatus Phytoplasma phoenicium]
MFKLNKNHIFFKIILFIGLELFLITNSHKVMAINSENVFTKQNMKIHNIFLEKVEDISYYVINNNYFECFSSLTLEYPCYNGTNTQHDLSWVIKQPHYWMIKKQPIKLLCVVFDKGIRDKMDGEYTLEDLKQMANGASNMYVFWLLNLNSKINEPKNIKDINKKIFYQLDIKFKEKEIGKISHQLNLLQNQITKLTNKIKAEKKYFKANLQALQLEILNLKNQKDNLENQLKSKQDELKANQTLNEEEKNKLKQQIKNIQNDLNQQIENNQTKTNKIEENKTHITQLEKQLSSNKQDLEKLQYEIKQKQTDLESKEQQLIEQKNLSAGEIQQLDSEVITLKTEINQEKINFEAQLSLKEEEIEKLKNKLKLLKTELENEKVKYQKIIINLEQKINTYSGIFDSLYKKIFHF